MTKKFAIAGLLILVVGAAVVTWVWFPWIHSPAYTIHVATGPVGSDGQKFITALKREMAEEHPRIHLTLEHGKVDLAVVRSDKSFWQ